MPRRHSAAWGGLGTLLLARITCHLGLQLLLTSAGAGAAPTAPTCNTFYAGLCPGTALCMCTLGEACGGSSGGASWGPMAAPWDSGAGGSSTGSPVPARALSANGTCAGQCRQVEVGQCGGPSTCLADVGPCVAPTPCPSPPPPRPASTFLLTLPTQGFPGHPGALVYVPSTFNTSDPQLALVVHVHGWHNCVQNAVLPTAYGCNCSVDGAPCQAYGLVDSFEAAAVAGPTAQSLLVAVEVAYDQASSDPGAWASPGVFQAFLQELLTAPQLVGAIGGPRTMEDVIRVRVFSHSGGYNVAAAFATPAVGSVPAVLEVVLLDSLYGGFDFFDAFVSSNLASFGPSVSQYRWVSLYTDSGGTEANNRAMAARVASWLPANETLMFFDDSLAPMAPASYKYPIVFKRSNFTHDDTCRNYFRDVLLYTV